MMYNCNNDKTIHTQQRGAYCNLYIIIEIQNIETGDMKHEFN